MDNGYFIFKIKSEVRSFWTLVFGLWSLVFGLCTLYLIKPDSFYLSILFFLLGRLPRSRAGRRLGKYYSEWTWRLLSRLVFSRFRLLWWSRLALSKAKRGIALRGSSFVGGLSI